MISSEKREEEKVNKEQAIYAKQELQIEKQKDDKRKIKSFS
jgi:hypothetical protein